MSDTVTKWHEMQEEKKTKRTMYPGDIYIYESPDRGNTITRRPFDSDVNEREVIQHPTSELKKKAYRLLTEYDEDVIRMAAKILDIGE